MPLRMVSHHESLDHPHAAPVARGNDGLCLGRVQPDRLFAQHVLAGPEGLNRPLDMQMVGQRIVDRVYLGIVQERLVITVTAGDAKACGDAGCPLGVARGDRRDDTALAGNDRRNDAFYANVSGTEDAPFDLAHLLTPSNLRCIRQSTARRWRKTGWQRGSWFLVYRLGRRWYLGAVVGTTAESLRMESKP